MTAEPLRTFNQLFDVCQSRGWSIDLGLRAPDVAGPEAYWSALIEVHATPDREPAHLEARASLPEEVGFNVINEAAERMLVMLERAELL